MALRRLVMRTSSPSVMPCRPIASSRATASRIARFWMSRSVAAPSWPRCRARASTQWYYSTRQANDDMWHCAQGVHAFLRAYFHMKSADWKGNKPFRLASWSAQASPANPRESETIEETK